MPHATSTSDGALTTTKTKVKNRQNGFHSADQKPKVGVKTERI